MDTEVLHQKCRLQRTLLAPALDQKVQGLLDTHLIGKGFTIDPKRFLQQVAFLEDCDVYRQWRTEHFRNPGQDIDAPLGLKLGDLASPSKVDIPDTTEHLINSGHDWFIVPGASKKYLVFNYLPHNYISAAMAVLASPRELTILDTSKPHAFAVPVKKINEAHDVPTFLSSRAYHDIMTFLLQLNVAMFPRYAPDSSGSLENVQIWELDCPRTPFSDTVKRLRKLLDELEKILDKVPPDPGPRRFGNASFRKWSDIVASRAAALLQQHLPAELFTTHGATEASVASEIESYFLGAFGSSQRLDYGTGHELSFLAFLGCIWKLGGFQRTSSGEEERGIVLGIIEPYLRLVRRLIKTYTLEPAGSHGVWGLDDHSFVPYIFGSAQYAPAIYDAGDIPLEGSREGSPNTADVVKAVTVERERKKNMYFGAIGFIYDVKKGPFWEHSPILFDISGVPAGWAKINKGMIKMYHAEVLSKFPVVQHFRFGSLFSWDQDTTPSPLPISIEKSKPLSKGQVRSSETGILSRTPHQDANLASTSAPWATQLSTTKPLPVSGTAAPWATQSSTTKPLPVSGTAAPWATQSSTRKILPVSGTAAPWATQSSTRKILPVSGTAAPWAASRQPVTDVPVISTMKMVPRPVHDTVIENQHVATQDNENLATETIMAPPQRLP